MSNIKISELTQAADISGNELIIISQSDGNGGWKSVNTTLTELSALYGGYTTLPVGRDLNGITDPGLYICQGAETTQESYNLNYPGGIYPGSEIPMIVSYLGPISEGGSPSIVQTMYFPQTADNPTPFSRLKTGGTFSTWTQSVSQSAFDTSAIQQKNYSQGGLQLQEISGSTGIVSKYNTPTLDTTGPSVKTAPSLKEGTRFTLPVPGRPSTIGTYSGNTLALDRDGKLFSNVGIVASTNRDDPANVNWREHIGAPVGGYPYIDDSDGTAEDNGRVLNALLAMHRQSGLLQYKITSLTELTGNGLDALTAGTDKQVEFVTLPSTAVQPVYYRSGDTSVFTLQTDHSRKTSQTSTDVDGDGTNETVGVQVNVIQPLAAGTTTLEIAADIDFTEILLTVDVTVI